MADQDMMRRTFPAPPPKNHAHTDARFLRNVHPMLSFDQFAKTHCGFYKAQHIRESDKFTRYLPLAHLCGASRPSPAFTSQGRAEKPMKAEDYVDMSDQPPLWYDGWKGSKTEGCYQLKEPRSVSEQHLDLFKTQHLMLPSERLAEHRTLKNGINEWRNNRMYNFEATKRRNACKNRHSQGITGIDGPTRPNSEIYKLQQARIRAKEEKAQATWHRRSKSLQKERRENDALGKGFQEDMELYNLPFSGTQPRSKDISPDFQRKDANPIVHPWRFMDSQDRLFTKTNKQWNESRAKALASHNHRNRRTDPVTGAGLSYGEEELHTAALWAAHDKGDRLMNPEYTGLPSK